MNEKQQLVYRQSFTLNFLL